jgi:hypothetical protein
MCDQHILADFTAFEVGVDVIGNDESEEKFGGYGIAIRTFWLTAVNLRISRIWRGEDVLVEETDQFHIIMSGDATSEDGISVIGDANRTNQFELSLNANDQTEQWTGVADGDQEEATPESKLNKHIYERLDEKPPTATLLRVEPDDDWEYRTEGGWFLECSTSKELLDQLVNDVLSGNTNKITIGIKWVGGLVSHEYAPARMPQTWGMLRDEDGRNPVPLMGHLTLLRWELEPSHAGEFNLHDDEALESRRKSLVQAYMGDHDGVEHAYEYGQLGYLFEEVTQAAKVYASKQNMTPHDFEYGVGRDAIELVREVRTWVKGYTDTGLADEKEPTKEKFKKEREVWRHELNPQHIVNSGRAPEIDRAGIEEAVSTYLAGHWRCSAMDHLLLDILVGMEFYAYSDEMVNEVVPPGFPPRSPLKQKHPILDYLQGSFLYLVIIAVPVSALMFASSENWIGEGWAVGISGVLSVVVLVMWGIFTVCLPSLWRKHNKARKQTLELMGSMRTVYQELKGGGPFSSRHFRKSLEAVEENGAVWPAPVFALLDDIDQRNGRF